MFERFFRAPRAKGRPGRRARASAWTTAIGACACALAWRATRDARAFDGAMRWFDRSSLKASTRARGDEDAETALRAEMARVDAVTNELTTPGVAEGVRRATRAATRGDGTRDDVGTARRPSEALAEACATLAATSACALLVKTAMNLIGRRGFLDRERREGGDTLDDASRAAFLSATTTDFARRGVGELAAIARAIVERELREFNDGREEDEASASWTREDAIDFMRRCRETLSRALLVPSDVFSDPKALPFERKNRLHVKAPRSFPSWESMLLPPKNPDFDAALGAPSSGAESLAERERQVLNLKDIMNETRLVIRSPHFVVALNDAMHAAWASHADAMPQKFFGATRAARLSLARAALVVEATADRIASDPDGLLASIANESGVTYFGNSIW
jgi:hypothetical protein